MSKFKVGDKVRCIKMLEGSYPELVGRLGKVIAIEMSRCPVGVLFPGWGGGHGLGGRLTGSDSRSGRWGEEENLELVTSKSTIMSKVSVMMKKLLDTDTQKLVKAGFINGDLMLTSSGKDALDAILFESNKKALVAAAEEVIKEEEESKK